MSINVTINKGLLRGAMDSFRNKRVVESLVAKEVGDRAKSSKNELINLFENHPVTKEIQSGPNGINSSGTLSGRGGNLFSFIGFYSGDDPIGKIRALFNKGTKAKARSLGRGKYSVSIDGIPSKESIIEASPMPWASGLSWAEGIEEGIIGLGSYLPLQEKGRSSGGIQIKGKSQAGNFQTTKYILSGIEDFIRDL